MPLYACASTIAFARQHAGTGRGQMASQTDSTASFLFCSVIRGHHIYKSVWTPHVGEVLIVKCKEPSNHHNQFAVCVLREEIMVGHVPREFSKTIWYFLRSGGHGSCTASGPRKHGKGLEVPCQYHFLGSRRKIIKLQNLLESNSPMDSCPY